MSNGMYTLATRLALLILALAGLLAIGEAWAVDGNYTSPYMTRPGGDSVIAALPVEALFGALLLTLNLLAVVVYTLRGRARARSAIASGD